jgi:hypothetical protein
MRAPIERPSLAWRLFVIVGVGALKALSFSDTAWAWWEENVTDEIPRSTVRRILAGTAVLHAVEAGVAYRWAGRAGVEHRRAWTRTTLVYGFPELRHLRRRIAASRVVVVD